MGKNSKRQEAEQARERRLRREQEEKEKQQQQNKIIMQILVALLAVVVLAGCIGLVITLTQKNNTDTPADGTDDQTDTEPFIPEINQMNDTVFTETDETTEYVKITITYTDKDGKAREGDVVVRLCADVAPITVANFQKLVSQKFYDGLSFHRVMSGFMIQGGDPRGDGNGGAAESIRGEFTANDIANNLAHVRGVISMARATPFNSASSQFFIVHRDSRTSLDGMYAAFGYVVSGMDTVDGVAGTEVVKKTPTSEKSTPVNPVTIVKAVFVQPEA